MREIPTFVARRGGDRARCFHARRERGLIRAGGLLSLRTSTAGYVDVCRKGGQAARPPALFNPRLKLFWPRSVNL
jgi:hypothetical protein